MGCRFFQIAKYFTFWNVTILTLFALPAQAIYLHALYTAACVRTLGLILNVDDSTVDFLTLDGKVERVPRHQIIYIAYYPMDHFPAANLIDLTQVDSIMVYTLKNSKELLLLQGWPINFSPDKISFFTTEGLESIIDRSNIFRLEVSRVSKPIRGHKVSEPLGFESPYAFRSCPKEAKGTSQWIYPEQVLADPVTIKRELDLIKLGHHGVRRYLREQKFYAQPVVYPKSTRLGLWQNFGSRYGSSNKRSNNFLPHLVDQHSSDLFSYQHRFITGSAPIPYSVHEESQTQFSYQFKASYFHFLTMVDPNLVLVGKNYLWQRGDFGSSDDRVNDSGILELGVDIGSWSIELYPANPVHYGVLAEDKFDQRVVLLHRLGFRYQSHLWNLQVMAGSGRLSDNTRDIALQFYRGNFGWNFGDRWNLRYSLIFRKLEMRKLFYYDSTSVTHFVLADLRIGKRYDGGGYFSVETHDNKYGSVSPLSSQSQIYPKVGGYFSLKF